jgi:hypothetical protein
MRELPDRNSLVILTMRELPDRSLSDNGRGSICRAFTERILINFYVISTKNNIQFTGAKVVKKFLTLHHVINDAIFNQNVASNQKKNFHHVFTTLSPHRHIGT